MQIDIVGMVELADASDSKSDMGNHVWVQVPLPAPKYNGENEIELFSPFINEFHRKAMYTNVIN